VVEGALLLLGSQGQRRDARASWQRLFPGEGLWEEVPPAVAILRSVCALTPAAPALLHY
jgi:hypothetical protein